MKVLIINSYSEGKLGENGFKIFDQAVRNAIVKYTIDEIPEIIVRKLDELGEFLVDWEYQSLEPNARDNAKKFDKLDIICISGDVKISPWEAKCYDAILLLHMFHLMNRPILSCGGASFSAIYATATQGVRFHIMNTPIGDSLEKLSEYPTYFKGTASHPCGWLDNETGDIYSYSYLTKSWIPVCNTGVYRNASTGSPTPYRLRPKMKNISRERRANASQQILETTEPHEAIIHIRNDSIHHFGFEQFPFSSFVATLPTQWYLNRDGALPLQDSLRVVADSAHGPVILADDISIHLALEINNNPSSVAIYSIINNFFKHSLHRIRENGESGRSLKKMLFAINSTSNESVLMSKPMAKPLSVIPVSSKLRSGVAKVDTPPVLIHHRPRSSSPATVKTPSSRRRGSNLCNIMQQPEMGRRKRMELFLKESGQAQLVEVQRQQAGGKDCGDNGDNGENDWDGSPEMNIPLVSRGSSRPYSPIENRGNLSARDAITEPLEHAQIPRRPHSGTIQRDNRLQWDSNWEHVRDVSNNWRKPSVPGGPSLKMPYESTPPINQADFLPVKHPPAIKEQPKSIVHVNKKIEHNEPAFIKTMKKQKEELNSTNYQGYFRGGHLSSFEKEVKEYNESKKLFLSGDFKRYNGNASIMPLRQAGGFQANGQYPAVGKHHKDESNFLRGPWRPTRFV